MIGKTPPIRYTDYDGNERDEEFYHNSTEPKVVGIDLNRNACGTTEYWRFYKKHISPSMIQSSHIPEQKPIEDAKLLAFQQAQIDYIYAHLVNDSVLSHNAYVTPNYWDFHEKHISKPKPPEQSNRKKSTAIVEVAVLIFLVLCLNGVFFWSFIFNLLTH